MTTTCGLTVRRIGRLPGGEGVVGPLHERVAELLGAGALSPVGRLACSDRLQHRLDLLPADRVELAATGEAAVGVLRDRQRPAARWGRVRGRRGPAGPGSGAPPGPARRAAGSRPPRPAPRPPRPGRRPARPPRPRPRRVTGAITATCSAVITPSANAAATAGSCSSARPLRDDLVRRGRREPQVPAQPGPHRLQPVVLRGLPPLGAAHGAGQLGVDPVPRPHQHVVRSSELGATMPSRSSAARRPAPTQLPHDTSHDFDHTVRSLVARRAVDQLNPQVRACPQIHRGLDNAAAAALQHGAGRSLRLATRAPGWRTCGPTATVVRCSTASARWTFRWTPLPASVTVHAAVGGDGPPVLLLHGFPQMHVMWHRVAPALARGPHRRRRGPPRLRRLVDGRRPATTTPATPSAPWPPTSTPSWPRSATGGTPWSGTTGAPAWRTACASTSRTPSPAPRSSTSCRRRTSTTRSTGGWPPPTTTGSSTSSPTPVPERLIAGDPTGYLHSLLGGWGSALDVYDPGTLAEYERCFADPDARSRDARGLPGRPRRSTTTSTPPTPRPAGRWRRRCSCCGAPAASSAGGLTTRSRCGGPAPGTSSAGRSTRATTSPRNAPTETARRAAGFLGGAPGLP